MKKLLAALLAMVMTMFSGVGVIFASAEDADLKELEKVYDDLICITVNGRPLKPKTLGQKKYIDLIKNNTVVFG